MKLGNVKWWLNPQFLSILGAEGEEGAGAGGTGEGATGEGGAGEGTGEGAGEGTGAGAGDEGASTDDGGAAALKKALENQRKITKAQDKELAAFRKAKQTQADAEKTEVERLAGEKTRGEEKVAKLAEGFKKSAVEKAVLAAAAKAKFRDPTDALRSEVIAAIGVEQDEDDPTTVEIDADTVAEAIKKLAKSKPHYLAGPAGTQGSGAPSGSKFGGGGNGGTQDDQKAALVRKYPALRGRVPIQ